MTNTEQLFKAIRKAELRLLIFSIKFLLKGFFIRSIRTTSHYKEWFHLPLSYSRQMEVPIAMVLLDIVKGEMILDVSSPKLLALYEASETKSPVVASDLENYFISDFEIFKENLNLNLDSLTIDASARIPFESNYFDKVFSISVLEHIPGSGDSTAFQEMIRVLKPGGSLVVTVPAWRTHMEEWATQEQYWQSVTDDTGKVFFQRRYDLDSLKSRFDSSECSECELVWIAEKPLKEPQIGPNGILQHNAYLIRSNRISRGILKSSARFPSIPLLPYLAERLVSKKCHYITRDHNDPNIRQAAIKVVK